MCFSPQRRAIFRRQNFKKCSETDVFFNIFTSNVLFATAACNFSTSELQKVLRNWRVLYIFTSKCAFRHSGVQFLISPLSSYLRTRRFNRPTFGLTRHTNHWKNTAFRDFSNIWRGCIFFLLTFALLHLLSADLTTLLCFSTVHIVGSFYLNFLRLHTYTHNCYTTYIYSWLQALWWDDSLLTNQHLGILEQPNDRVHPKFAVDRSSQKWSKKSLFELKMNIWNRRG